MVGGSYLHASLLRLRQTDGDRLLWIDALAVDQSNIPERNTQVVKSVRESAIAARIGILLYSRGHSLSQTWLRATCGVHGFVPVAKDD
jgi:Heterokaryon incompatibility protein (HET)